jgi:hypothetical protein
MLEKIGAKSYILELPSNLRMHPEFHVNNLRPCPTATLHSYVHFTIFEGDGDEYDIERITVF